MVTDEHHHHRDVAATLLELADTLGSDYDVIDYLDTLLQRSCALLEVDAGGVMLANGNGSLELMVSTSARTRLLELFEIQGDQGPCLDSYRLGERVIGDDLAEHGALQRWPQFAAEALGNGYTSVYAFPLRWRNHAIGALNLFGHEPGPVGPLQLQGAQAMAQMAAIGILQERAVRESRELAGHLQTALNSRVIIEQAKGVLAERGGIDMGRAYDTLRAYCRNRNLSLRDTASAVAASELPADEILRS